MNWLERLEDLDEQATPRPWHYHTSIPDTELAAHLRNKAKEIAQLAEAVEKCKQAFMAIDDGFFTGLVPPEFASVCEALNNLLRDDGR